MFVIMGVKLHAGMMFWRGFFKSFNAAVGQQSSRSAMVIHRLIVMEQGEVIRYLVSSNSPCIIQTPLRL